MLSVGTLRKRNVLFMLSSGKNNFTFTFTFDQYKCTIISHIIIKDTLDLSIIVVIKDTSDLSIIKYIVYNEKKAYLK